MKQYTKTHEWVEIRDGFAYVGISKFAADELGEAVYVSLPEEGQEVNAGEPFCEIESVKAVAEVNSPVCGVVRKVNETLADVPETVNQNPDEWICAVEYTALADNLMSEAEYAASLE